jgi:asparagine synthase (glutamine-hydrolysing)
VEWGQWVRIDQDGRIARSRFDGLRTPPRWTGDFEEAVAELERRARRAVTRRARRHPITAIALSGGLDSSALAWLAKETQAPAQKLFAVSSVSPPGSGVADERSFIETVARALDLRAEFVSPPDDADILVPPAHIFDHAEGPIVGPRHYLYDSLYAAARRGGATAVLDGSMGEFSLSRRATLATPYGAFRDLLRQSMSRVRGARAEPWPWAGLHVEPSAQALRLMTETFGDAPVARPDLDRPVRPPQQLGYPVGVLKVGKWLTDTPGGELRHLKPFFDRSMIELAAGAPASFTQATGLPRSFVRAMLQDRLPASIVRRTSKQPFSPDFYLRLCRHAPAARDRIRAWRAAGADQWLDLEWLDGMLGRIVGGPLAPAVMFRIQSTANAAEFFVWLASKR